jgi:hypothetical protein
MSRRRRSGAIVVTCRGEVAGCQRQGGERRRHGSECRCIERRYADQKPVHDASRNIDAWQSQRETDARSWAASETTRLMIQRRHVESCSSRIWRHVDLGCLDSDSKLVVSWPVGKRDARHAQMVIDDLKNRLSNRVQITTDGLRAYADAIEDACGADVDFAMLVKLYGEASTETPERKYPQRASEPRFT